ncbi:MAG: hypothetical protein QXE05_07155 [Nitrososphaeria archaeon]
MAKEIVCPHCHVEIVPKETFSIGTFLMLIFLGILPFTLYLIGMLMIGNSIFSIFNLIRSYFPQTPLTPELQIIKNQLDMLSLGTILLLVSSLILTLIVGLIPAINYWINKKDSYKCPVCELRI